MTARPRSSTRDALALHALAQDRPLLPTHYETSTADRAPSNFPLLSRLRSTLSLKSRSRPKLVYFLLALVFLCAWYHTALGTLRRDVVYLLRPLWDTPPLPFDIIPHFPPVTSSSGDIDTARWCGLHGWTARTGDKPTMVDAILLSTELDLLEVRMREYKDLVDTFVIVESDKTFAGTPKERWYDLHRHRFESILAGSGSRVVYKSVEGLLPDRPAGSFENEYTMRTAVSNTLTGLRLAAGSIVIQSDVDEIVSRDTLQLLASCNVPDNLHLNVKNYRYGFSWPIPDSGYWRPHITLTDGGPVGYSHGRVGNVMLEGAGWHCTFCFKTFGEMRQKMLGYSHNDRVRDARIASVDRIKERVCNGHEPFNMWPEAFTMRDLIAQSDPLTPSHDFGHIPLALQQDPERFAYLLDKGCDRTDE